MVMISKKQARNAARGVLAELSGRKGFDYWFEEIDSDIKTEIRLAIASAIMKGVQEADDSATKIDAVYTLHEIKLISYQLSLSAGD